MKTWILLISLAVGVVMLAGCRKDTNTPTSKPKKTPVVTVTAAVQGPMVRTLELTGSITAAKIATMGSPAEGPVTQCSVREGDRVEGGQLLLNIGRNKAADARLAAAQESLQREHEDAVRVKNLVESGAIAAEELEVAQLRVSRAKADLSTALEGRDDFAIKAPWTGLVAKVLVTDGYYVAPREPLVEMYDPTSLVIRCAVPEKQVTAVHVGMPVTIRLDAHSEKVYPGKLTRLYPELNRQTRTRLVEAELMTTESPALLPGMFARVQLELERIEQAVRVPAKALVLSAKGTTGVFVVQESKAHFRQVHLGLEQDQTVQVTNGIHPGEQVVTAGHEKLKDGATVKVAGSSIKPTKGSQRP